MSLINRRKEQKPSDGTVAVQTGKSPSNPFSVLDRYVPLRTPQSELYLAIREAVPIVDAAIFKLVRLAGGFKVICSDERAQKELDKFAESVNVNGTGTSLETFIASYFEQLLTFGTAIGEIVTDSNGRIAALYNADLRDVELMRGSNPLDVQVCTRINAGETVPVKYPQLVLLSVLNPDAGELKGNSLLKGLPFVSSVLMKIYNTIGVNWERVGNVRFAVTYKPQNDSIDRAYAKERAMQIAHEWGEAMQNGQQVKDFVSVGDVSIKVIGADNQILNSEIPVRQMLEQIVAKTGLPPFMLGLSWSSTERMSSQQADVLTSELESYRRILSPVISKICGTFLRAEGFGCEYHLEWNDITLQDEVELARARLYNAQAEKTERENGKR